MPYDLAAIRARLDDPRAVASALGLIDGPGSIQRHTRGLLCRCPAHGDRTPSCLVTRGDSGVTFFCFGCRATGDVFGLVAAVERLDVRGDFRRVVERAADLAGVREGEALPDLPRPAAPPPPPRLDDALFDALAGVLARECPVDAEPDARAYLAARGLGHVGAGVLAALPADPLAQDRLADAIAAEIGEDGWRLSGLANARGSWLFPGHRLVMFWRGPGGAVETLQRRLLRAPRDAREPKYVFASRRSPRWPYGLERAGDLGPGGEVAFVEGALDVLAMRALCARAGVDRLVLGLPGTAAWSRAWAHLAAGRVAVVALDADDAGETAAEAVARDLYAAGAAMVRRATPDGAKDWAELLALQVAA